MSHLGTSLDRQAVLVHLQARVPGLLQREDFQALFAAEVEGVAAEIIAYSGDPELPDAASPIRLRALSLGVAASIESSLFPEQQLGEGQRSSDLQRRFVAVLAMLRERFPAGPPVEGSPGGTNSRYWSGMVPL